MSAKKLFYLLKLIPLYISGIVFLICFQNCEEPAVQENKGFLAYSPGYGVTEGVHIASYENSIESGYILLGSTDNGIEKDYFIVKTDSSGNFLLSKQTGDHNLDNKPNKVKVQGDFIYILGDRYDRYVNRVVPFISILNLSDLSKISGNAEIYLDNYNDIFGTTYEEKSADFLIDGDKIIITSSSEDVDGKYSLLTYILTMKQALFGKEVVSSEFSRYDNNVFSAYNIKAQSIRKGQDEHFYVAGTLTEGDFSGEYGKGYFIVKYKYDGELISTIYNDSLSNTFKTLLDFELDLANNKAIVLYRNNNMVHVNIIELSNGNNTTDRVNAQSTEILGLVHAIDEVSYDVFTLEIIDETKSASINKIGNNYIITGIRDGNFAMIVDKRSLNGASLSAPEWGNVWEDFNVFNNISSFGSHDRNNIGNVIQRVGGEGYAIIGTHDFINTTKMILIQLDENGNYY